MATPEDVQEKIVTLSLSRPGWSCNRLSDQLKLEGISVSTPTVQNILNKADLGTRFERWLRLEPKDYPKGDRALGPTDVFIENQNPCFREKHVESSRPGELLNQDTFFFGHLTGWARTICTP